MTNILRSRGFVRPLNSDRDGEGDGDSDGGADQRASTWKRAEAAGRQEDGGHTTTREH